MVKSTNTSNEDLDGKDKPVKKPRKPRAPKKVTTSSDAPKVAKTTKASKAAPSTKAKKPSAKPAVKRTEGVLIEEKPSEVMIEDVNNQFMSGDLEDNGTQDSVTEANDIALDEEVDFIQASELDESRDTASLNEFNDAYFSDETAQDLLSQIAGVYHIWLNWAHFELTVVSPWFELIEPPIVIHPEELENGDIEFVYPIHDHGNKFSTSKGTEMYTVGTSMCKFYYTIEKMIFLLIERMKSGGIDTETEVQVMFDGHDLARRKAFESIINLTYNVVVTNFDPGVWGERYLETVKRLAARGYGYPKETPRVNYRQSSQSSTIKR